MRIKSRQPTLVAKIHGVCSCHSLPSDVLRRLAQKEFPPLSPFGEFLENTLAPQIWHCGGLAVSNRQWQAHANWKTRQHYFNPYRVWCGIIQVYQITTRLYIYIYLLYYIYMKVPPWRMQPLLCHRPLMDCGIVSSAEAATWCPPAWGNTRKPLWLTKTVGRSVGFFEGYLEGRIPGSG